MFKLKEKINTLELNTQKENVKITIPIILLVLIVGFLAYYFKNYMIVSLLMPLILVYLFIISTLYDKKIIAFHHQNESEFVVLTNYIQTYLQNGFNVYKSFESSIQFVSPWMKNKIGRLLSDIDNDKTIAPFIRFAHYFNSSLVEQVMISLFLMVDNGANTEYIVRFTPIFKQLEKDSERKTLKNIEGRFDTLNLLPVIGSALITLLIITGVVGLIGGALNGI